ncbi:hypothetical protein SDC9_41942 [bioreactor metagenome]|uniref:Uncharacterized protein n=1 Tax=bioreactor metagenome TaxID=1076179 RepID=A0A644VX22_9ZZZZ
MTLVNWVELFGAEKYRNIVIDGLKFCQENKGLRIFVWVIMPSHIHLVADSLNGNLSKTIGEFKRHTSKTIYDELKRETEFDSTEFLTLFRDFSTLHSRNNDYQVWIQDNHPVELFSSKFIDQKIDYIHNNPVKAGYVEKTEDYLYSSARNYADMPELIDVELA